MIKHSFIAVCSVSLIAGCAEGVEPDSSSEEVVVRRPDRNITFATPVEQDALESEGRIKATDIARSASRLADVKPILEVPKPPIEETPEPSPLVR